MFINSRLKLPLAEPDTREEATAGSRLWDKLLLSAGSVSKSITAKLKDDGYNSDSDEEGVDTHVIKVLRDYYLQKGQGTPVWLGGSGSNVRPPTVTVNSQDRDISRPNGATQNTSARTGKVSLKGIYEQAAERTSSQQQLSPRHGISRTSSQAREQTEAYVPRRSEESARSVNSTAGRLATMSAGERFREKMKNNRSMSSQSQTQGDTLSPQQTRSGRGSLEVPRDSASMANRLKRGGPTSSYSQNKF